MMRAALALSALLVVAACDRGPVVTHDPTGQLGICPAPAFQEFVGQAYANTAFNWPSMRVIRPGDAVTKDYREDRLNIDLDAQDRITGIWCG